MKICQFAVSLSVAILLFGQVDRQAVRADDWPQWQGPDRNNVSKETGLLKSWPKDGPKLLWTFEKAGVGYSGPAVVGDHLYTMGGREDTSYVFAIDVKSSKELWSCPVGKTYKNGYGDGPRSTPTIDGDSLYALDATGELICVETASGKKRWSVNLQEDLHGELMGPPRWGFSIVYVRRSINMSILWSYPAAAPPGVDWKMSLIQRQWGWDEASVRLTILHAQFHRKQRGTH